MVMEADPDLFGLETGTIEEAAQTLEQVHNVRPEPPPDSDETAWAVCPVCGFHATSGWPGISAHLGVTEASGRPGCRLLYRVLMKRANPLLGRQSLPRSAWEIEETPVDEEGAPAGAAAGDAAGDDGDAAGGAEGDAAGGPAATTPRLRRRAAPPRSSPRPRSASKLPPGEVLLRYRVVRRACDRAEDTRRSRLQRARGDDGDDSDASGDFGAVPGCQGSSAGGDDGDGSPGRAGGRRSRGRERTASRAGRAAAAAAAAAMAAAGLGGSSSESGEQEDSSDGAWGRGGDDDSSEGDGDEGPSDVEAEAARARAEEEEEEAAAAAEGEDWDDDDGGLRPMDSSPSGTGVSAGARRGRRASRGPVAPPRELDLGGLFSVRAARRVSGRVSGATAARLLRERSAHSVFLAAAFASGVNMVPPAAKLKLGPCPAVWSDGVSLGFAPFAALASAAREEQVPEACIAPSPQAPPLSSSSPPSSSEPASDSGASLGDSARGAVAAAAPAAAAAAPEAAVPWLCAPGSAQYASNLSAIDPLPAGTAKPSPPVLRALPDLRRGHVLGGVSEGVLPHEIATAPSGARKDAAGAGPSNTLTLGVGGVPLSLDVQQCAGADADSGAAALVAVAVADPSRAARPTGDASLAPSAVQLWRVERRQVAATAPSTRKSRSSSSSSPADRSLSIAARCTAVLLLPRSDAPSVLRFNPFVAAAQGRRAAPGTASSSSSSSSSSPSPAKSTLALGAVSGPGAEMRDPAAHGPAGAPSPAALLAGACGDGALRVWCLSDAHVRGPAAAPGASVNPPSPTVEPPADGEAEGSRVDLGAPAAVLAPAFVAWAGSGAAITSCDWSPLDPGLILAGTADGELVRACHRVGWGRRLRGTLPSATSLRRALQHDAPDCLAPSRLASVRTQRCAFVCPLSPTFARSQVRCWCSGVTAWTAPRTGSKSAVRTTQRPVAQSPLLAPPPLLGASLERQRCPPAPPARAASCPSA